MDIKLVVVGGANAGQEVPVPGPKFFIGRAEDCQLRPRSDQVSRYHAAILVEEGFVAVRDFGSRNGTFVNGERVRTERELKNGDQLRLGPLEFEVWLAVEVGGKKKPKVHSVSEAAARTAEAGTEGDIDIFDLLGDEAAPQTATAADTQTNVPHAAKDTVTMPLQPSEASPEKESKKKKKKKAGGLDGQLPNKGMSTTDSSRTAAEDMLRKFMNR